MIASPFSAGLSTTMSVDRNSSRYAARNAVWNAARVGAIGAEQRLEARAQARPHDDPRGVPQRVRGHIVDRRRGQHLRVGGKCRRRTGAERRRQRRAQLGRDRALHVGEAERRVRGGGAQAFDRELDAVLLQREPGARRVDAQAGRDVPPLWSGHAQPQ